MNFKKIFVGSLAAGALLVSTVIPAFAVGKAAPKTTGGVGYTAGGLQRYAEFNAIETSDTCSAFDLTGSYVFSLYGGTYTHDINITQTGSSLVVTGGYPAGALTYTYNETGTGSVTGNTFTFTNTYTETNYSYTVNGTVNLLDGSITITSWSGGPGSDWSVAGNAALVFGCTGKGSFYYSDVNGDWYYANVQYVNVDGTNADAYFAGQVTSASQPSWIGNWVQVADHDGGEPAYLVDHIWGIFTDSSTAKYNVANMVKPDGDFVITSGNLQVH